jgi:AraC family transcriptional regulator of adaptative response / methylphosphotriester-DNA alkyltransferase methyltransferase
MTKKEYILDDIKWVTVKNCDENYDGKFFYGVITTKIFCRPSCKSRTPLRKNTVFFENIQEALDNGFRPCKRCRPDLLVYDPTKDLLEKVRKTLDSTYSEPIDIKTVSQNIGISEFYLMKLFKKHFEYTPKEYILKVRIDESLKLLIATELDITEIAHKVGFESISSYYKNFSRIVNCTPKQYRNKFNKSCT